MFTYYQVNNTYNFTHYGKALHFARSINGKIVIKRSWNPLRVFSEIYESI